MQTNEKSTLINNNHWYSNIGASIVSFRDLLKRLMPINGESLVFKVIGEYLHGHVRFRFRNKKERKFHCLNPFKHINKNNLLKLKHLWLGFDEIKLFFAFCTHLRAKISNHWREKKTTTSNESKDNDQKENHRN